MRSRLLKGEGVAGTSSSYRVSDMVALDCEKYLEVVAGYRWRRRSRRLGFRHARDWQLI